MIITASRKDDILKRKAQYDADYAAYKERQAGYQRAYNEAEDAVISPIKTYLEKELSKFGLNFDVTVRRGWLKGSGIDIVIGCNEHNKFDENSALSWSYQVSLDEDGNVVKETNSWSGLKAITKAQIASLKATVHAIEFLNEIDWDNLMHVQLPNYSDYYDKNDKRPEREDFESQLKEAELEELVGANKIIKVYNWGESCPYRGDVWLKINRETPSMYFANIIPNNYIRFGLDDVGDGKNSYITELQKFLDGNYGEYRIRKSSVRPVTPIETREV